jgi:hypothetical protein
MPPGAEDREEVKRLAISTRRGTDSRLLSEDTLSAATDLPAI